MNALDGIKVLDATIWQQGTYATAMLADWGADVIKIEGPDSPDPGRGFAANEDGLSAYFESHNRGKRSLVLDLKNRQGRGVLLKLAESADVFVQNMRQGVMERLGLAYSDLNAVNAKIIYASASGYGAKGPHRTWPAMDILGQARGGTMSVQGPSDSPPTQGFGGMADQVGAISLAFGIMMALYHRERTGEGQEVDASLLGGQVMLQSFNLTNVLFNQPAPQRRARTEADPMWNSYPCRDGGWITLGMAQSDKWWERFCKVLGRMDLHQDARFCDLRSRVRHRHELIRIFDEVFATRDQWDWVNAMAEAGLPCAPVQDYAQVVNDPQVIANGYVVEVDYLGIGAMKMVGPAAQLSKTPGQIRRGAPAYSEHTEEVLLEHGYTWEDIISLREAGAVGPRG